MAELIKNQVSATDAAKGLAQKNLEDTFKGGTTAFFNILSRDITPYLLDYFILINDLKFQLDEENRHAYSDYGFVVAPVHKAFESYLGGILKSLFKLKVSHRKNETIGFYLNMENKDSFLENMKKSFTFLPDISKKSWVATLNALCQEWNDNRNPLTHPDGEKITSLRQAESVASSIIRQMDLSSQLLVKEFYNPFKDYIVKEVLPKKAQDA